MANKQAGRTATDWTKIARYATLGAWVFGIGGIIVTASVLVPRLVQRTASAQPSSPVRVVLVNEPSWLPKEDRRALEIGVLKSLSGGPLDREGLQSAMTVAERSGWYDTVHQVRRPDLDRVEVEGVWATPFALVSDAHGEHLVDTKARLLPRTYAAGQGPNLLRIQGVTQTRPVEHGAAWQGADVNAALHMAALMNERAWKTQIAAIDVSTFTRDGIVRLRTDKGCELVWGRTPGQENAAEVPAHQKIAALQYLYDHYRRIDAGCEQVLDLRSDVVGAR